MADEKRCGRCGEVKLLAEFYRRSGGRTDRSSECKECIRAASRAWKAANPERARAADAAWRIANLERKRAAFAVWRAANLEHVRAYQAAYCDANREKARASTRAWRAANPEREKENGRKWQAANPDKCQESSARRRARKANAPVVERIYRAKVWERDGGRCHICGRKADPKKWHLEHIVPLAAGGEHSYRNVAVSHPACNLRKGVNGPAQARLLA